MYNKNNAFTLIELVVIVIIIGILMMATTVYLGSTDEQRKVIEAQGCANTIGGELYNFIFYTLTSKNLKKGGQTISPNYYIIEFTGGNNNYCSSGNTCDKINLSYSTGENSPTNITTYKTVTISNTCNQTNQLKFYWSGSETNYIIMNKGFYPLNINDNNIFYLSGNDGRKLIGNIIVGLCISDDCISPKEIGKFVADARSQTISFKKCKYYDNINPTKCKTREGCKKFNTVDQTLCEEY